jgi:hypothetical protein
VRPLALGVFLILGPALILHPQTREAEGGRLSQTPRQIFVGDRGRLILTLGRELQNAAAFSIIDSRLLPQSPELRLHRLEFDPRRNQVVIDFTAFALGELEIPPIQVPELPGVTLEGCRVSIASTLVRGDWSAPSSPEAGGILVLSGFAPPLAVPGTALLIYGTSSLIILILLFLLGMGLWGKPYMAKLIEARRRRRLIRLMGTIGEGLRKRIPLDPDQTILRKLSVEFRAFLGYFFDSEGGGDCRAMTAEEFYSLPPLFSPADEDWAQPVSAVSLGNFFRRLDRLRFSGEKAGAEEISALLDRTVLILSAIEWGCKVQGKS